MQQARGFLRFGRVVFVWVAAFAACTPDFDATRNPAPAGTVGEEVYGVVCDRVGAQALPEDLTGGSFNGICHKSASGAWSNTVDTSLLPPITSGLTTASGQPVSVATAQASRNHGIARIQALAAKRTDLITALDATFPNVLIPIKYTSNPNPAETCNPAPNNAKDPLPSQLAALLGRFTKLYDDGTIPASTESFARVMEAFNAQPDAQAAYARFNARQGYRPLDVALGVVRPILGYPQLRDFANATLNLLSSTGNVYATPEVPGAAYGQLQELLAAAYQELRTTTVGTPLGVETVSGIDPTGRWVLSRPWDNLEFMQQIFYAQDPAFGGGASQFIVQRDPRGYALVPLMGGVVPPPFEDTDHDGLADVNSLGQFITTDGTPAPTPFFSFDGPSAPASDGYGRAMTSPTGSLHYGYIDTSHVYAANLMNDVKAFVDPVPADAHETMMNALAGAYVLMGTRTSASKTYAPDPSLVQEWSLTHGLASPPADIGTAPVKLAYTGYDGSNSPMLDLVYGLGNVVADRTNDDVLAYSNALLEQDVTMVARLVGDGLTMQANAKSHPEAHIPPKSTFWDEMIDVIVQIEQVPGLLEDILTALGNDDSLLIPNAFSAYSHYNDAITYDTNNLNGPPFNLTTSNLGAPNTPVNRASADTGTNRSEFQRFIALIHDTDGLTVCNTNNASVLAQLPVLGETTLPIDLVDSYPWGYSTFPECSVFKIENAAAFYLDAIVGKANLYLRDDNLRNGVNIGVGNVGAATVGLMEDSSGLQGFWDDSGSTTLRPTPAFLDRQMFFDTVHDSPNPGDPNYMTNAFLTALVGTPAASDPSEQGAGTMVCPERIIIDPCGPLYTGWSDCTDAPDIASDGYVHGLRSCPAGQLLVQRDPNTIFVWEDESFYQAMTPVINAFANHNSEQLFINLMETLDRHWADMQGTASECLLSVDPSAPYKTCTGDGLVTYEPLLVEQYASDLIPALHDLVAVLQTLTVPHCDAIDPTTHACTPTPYNGITVMANTIRSLFDPNLAAAAGLKNRDGTVTGLRNDGTTNPQVTRIYLILQALNGIDAAFADYAAKNPKDAARQTSWLSARSQIVDQLFAINGTHMSSAFADPSVPKVLPVIVNALRSQLVAHCPSSFNAPYPPCAWAGQDLTNHIQETVTGPTFAGAMDLADAIRQSDTGRQALEQLLTYLLDAASTNQARAIALGAADDLIQSLADDKDLVPFYHVLAEAARPSVQTSSGVVVQKGVADAQMGLLSDIAGRAETIDSATGKVVEDCSPNAKPLAELDPNQVLNVALTNLVTPMKTGDKAGETPLEVILDAVDAVNRAAPQSSTAELNSADYASISQNLDEFLLDKQRGLEQFYEVVRLGTE
jgi:hypothetical protein